MPTMEITTMIGCPVMCTYCPQEVLRKRMVDEIKYLSFGDFKNALNKIPKNVRIDFSGMCEPWANPECTDMFRYAISEGYIISIYTTLYGMSIDDAHDVIGIIRSHPLQIADLVIHLQDKNNNMKGLKLTNSWMDVANEFVDLYNLQIIKGMRFMTMDSEGSLHPALENLSSIVPKVFGISRAGTLVEAQVGGQAIFTKSKIPSRIKCSFTTYYDHNVLLPNGEVLLCCMDYGKKHVIGNLFEETYYELFLSKSLSDLRLGNMHPDSMRFSICRSCERAVEAN